MRTNQALLTGLIIMTGATYTQAQTLPLVFGTTYVSAGANAEFGGDVVANTYFVAGASTTVTGNIQTGTAVTLGAGSIVGNTVPDTISDIISGTATTIGASGEVAENVNYGTALTIGASALVPYHTPGPATAMSYNSGKVDAAKDHYNGLDNTLIVNGDDTRNFIESTMPSDITLDPRVDSDEHGLTRVVGSTVVYNASSLTTGEGITLTLAGPYDFVFNVADMLSLGAKTNMILGDGVGSVTWNTGGYASVGAEARIIGTVFAGGYVSTGVDSVVEGANNPSTTTSSAPYYGGLFSATSYVTIGASGTVKGVIVPQ